MEAKQSNTSIWEYLMEDQRPDAKIRKRDNDFADLALTLSDTEQEKPKG